MPRRKRLFISHQYGLYHIISRVAGGYFLFQDPEKEYFVKTLERFSSGFYVRIHAFAILSNHFHLLVSERTEEAKKASREDLVERYHLLFGKDAEPPFGRQGSDGSIVPDEDGGQERLRTRLGSVSRFVQELKQTYSRWFNQRHHRTGYLWSNRFSSLAVQRGEPELICSAYIDLNAVRAGIVKTPEAYRWCSLGMSVRNPRRHQKLLSPLLLNTEKLLVSRREYRLFVYRAGSVNVSGKANIESETVEKVTTLHGRMTINSWASYRIRNLSEGAALGSEDFVVNIQRLLHHKTTRPRSVAAYPNLFCSRLLSSS